ncbi:MAG: DUF1565 domain-containing protein [Myxococcales bacterium]|nr:DUF1565 domain-containing protein [Myxococcales bacterium]
MRKYWLIVMLAVVLGSNPLFIACSDDDDDNNNLTGDDDHTVTDDDLADDEAADDDVIDDDQADDDDLADDDTGGEEEDFYAPPPTNDLGIFVSTTIGNDANPGTMAAPVKTIAKGVQLAEAANKAVFVAEGVYPEGFSSNVSLFGGYRPSDWQRDPEAYLTSIQSPDGTQVNLTGGSAQVPQILEGFSIAGGDAVAIGYYAYDESFAVEVSGEEAIIAHNRITGGQAIASGFIAKAKTAGIRVYFAGSTLIRDNVVTANQAFIITASEAYSYGILVYTESSVETRIEENHIGTMPTPGPHLFQGPANGVEIRGGMALLVGNEIEIGPSAAENSIPLVVDDSGSVTAVNNLLVIKPNRNTAEAVVWAAGPATLINNTLINQTADIPWGIGIFSEVVLINNIFSLGPSNEAAMLFINDQGQHLISLIHNDLFCNADTLNLIDAWFWTIDDLDELNQCLWEGCREAAGNLIVNPGFISSADAHLAPTSPCIDAGVDPSPWYAGPEIHFDFDGEARPQGAGWDIGFDEFVE